MSSPCCHCSTPTNVKARIIGNTEWKPTCMPCYHKLHAQGVEGVTKETAADAADEHETNVWARLAIANNGMLQAISGDLPYGSWINDPMFFPICSDADVIDATIKRLFRRPDGTYKIKALTVELAAALPARLAVISDNTNHNMAYFKKGPKGMGSYDMVCTFKIPRKIHPMCIAVSSYEDKAFGFTPIKEL